MSGSHVSGMDSRVEVDHLIALDGHLHISGLDHLEDPLAEGIADQRIGDVADPLLRQLTQLLLDGHVLQECHVLAELIQDGLDLEALVLRHRQVSEIVRYDKTERRLERGSVTYFLVPQAKSLRK
jgi:hypothetical protein